MPVKRWNVTVHAKRVNPQVDAFLADIFKVYERHGFAIGHEDEHGAFVIQKTSPDLVAWMNDANDATGGF